MAKIIFGMNMSLDGYVDHMLFQPDATLFRHFIEMVQASTGSIYGRRLYEIMSYWDQDQADWTPDLKEYASAWRRMPKWVVSRSLTSVGPNATLINDDIEATIRKLKNELAGDIEVGGPVLASSLIALRLIDEVQIYLHPVVLGQGQPFFAGIKPMLRLVSSDRIGESAVRLTYAPT